MSQESRSQSLHGYPFSSAFLRIGEYQYHYVEEGSGPPVLFVHGNPTWSYAWRRFLADLSDRYHTVAVDHLGMGLSDKPQDYEYRLEQHVENLCEFIRHKDLREITLVGHDWGGCIGMGAATRLPERFRRFVFMNTAAFRSKRIPFRIACCRWPVLGALGVRGLNLFSRAALSMAVARTSALPADVAAGYVHPYDSWAHRIAVHRFVQDIPMSSAHPSYETLVGIEDRLDTLANRSMLLVWGAKDWCFDQSFLAEWQRRFPDAESFVIPDAGHYVFEDAYDEILPRLRTFLDKTEEVSVGSLASASR